MRVFCELLPVINTMNVYINFENAESFSDIKSERNVIILSTNIAANTNPITLELCKGITLKPNSISGLHFECNWITFRIQLDMKTSLINSVFGEIIRDISSIRIESNFENCIFNSAVQLKCKCDHPLSENKAFKLCPLPSTDWDLASENWFCHLHEDHKSSIKESHLSPKSHQCFYNELTVQINLNDLLSMPDGSIVLCKECKSEIGLKKGNYVKFWTNDIKWVGEKVSVCKSTTEILEDLIHNLLKDSLGATSRFVLELDGNVKEFLYILTMDKHLDVLTVEDSSLSNFSTTKNDASPPKKLRCDTSSNYLLKKISSIKLLFKHKTLEDEESGSWVDDVNVNILSCGKSFFHAVFHLLESSNKCLPNNIRTVNDLKVGYVFRL